MKLKSLLTTLAAVVGITTAAMGDEPRTISINFGNQGSVTGEYGIVPSSNWNNFTGNSNSSGATANVSDGSTVKVYWWSHNVHQWTDATDVALKGYLDDGACGDGATSYGPHIGIKGIPFACYDVIVYLATDTANYAFNPPAIGKWTKQTECSTIAYSYDGSVAKDRNNTAIKFGASQNKTAILGQNVVYLKKGFGYTDLDIKGGSNANTARGGIAAVQIVERLDTSTPTISVNFQSGTASVDGMYGIVPSASWVNASGTSGTDVEAAASDDSGTAKVTYSCANTWNYNNNWCEPALRGYLDDGSDNNRISITVTDIPFDYYDVIVYQAADTGSYSFNPPCINGTWYSYDGVDTSTTDSDSMLKYGATQNGTASVGENVAYVKRGFSGELTIKGAGNKNSARGGIAAIQIVKSVPYVPPAPEEKMATSFVTEGAPTEAYGANVKNDLTAYGQQAKYTTEGFGQVVAVTNATSAYTIFGGAAKSAGAITTDIWMEVLGGTFKSIFGGSNSDDWSGGSACSITGDIVLEVGGNTETENVLGGNYKDGKSPTIDGNITVVVKDNAVVKGVIAGSGMSAHSGLTTVTGNTKVTVKNIQSDNSAGALIGADSSDYIVGGGVYGTNTKSREVVNGNSEVVIDIEAGEGNFVKNIVGGGLIPSGGANHNETVTATVGGNSSVTITVPSTVTFTGNIIAGGSVTGGGDATVTNAATVTLGGGKYSGSIKGGVALGTKTLAIADDIVIAANDNEVSGFDAFTVADGKKVTVDADADAALTFALAGSGTIGKTGEGKLTMQGLVNGAAFDFVAKEGAITASGATYSSSFSAEEGASVSFVWDLSTGGEITSVPTLKSSTGTLAFTVTLNKTDILGSRELALANLSAGMTADDVDVTIINADSGNAVLVKKELKSGTLYATPDAAARDLVYKPTEATEFTWEAGTTFGDKQFRDYDNVSFQTADDAAVEVDVSVPANISAGNLEIGATYTFTGKPIIAGDVKTLTNADVTFENDLVADSVVVTDGSSFKAAEIVASEVAVTNSTFESAVVGPSMKFVRLTITETQTSGNQPAVGEFRLYRGSKTTGYSTVDWPVGTKISDCTGLTATKTTDGYPGEVGAGLGNVGGNECQPGDLIDGYYGNKSTPKIYGNVSAYSTPAYNKWWPTSVSKGPWTVTIEFPYPVATFSGCNFCLADHGPRNPTAWTIEVSSDGQEWIEVNNTSNATWNAQYEWAGEGEKVPAFLNDGTTPTDVKVGDKSTIVADGNWTAALEVGGAVTFKGIAGKKLTLDAASTSQFDEGATLTFDLTDYDVTAAGKQYVIAGPTEGWPEVGNITVEPTGVFDLEMDEEGYYVIVKSGNYWLGDSEGVGTWDFKKTQAWGEDAESTVPSIWLNDVAANFTRNGTVTIDTSAGEIVPTAINITLNNDVAVTFKGDLSAIANVPINIGSTNDTLTIENTDAFTLPTFTAVEGSNPTIAKTGAGTLTLPNTVDFNGGALNVNEGKVTLSDNNSLKNANTVTVAGTLELNGTSNNRGYVLSEGGSLVNNGTAVATGSMQMNALTLNGNATVGGTGDFGILGSQWGDTTLTLNGNTLTKTGTNSFWLCNTAVSDGTIDLQGGVIDTNSGDTTIPGTLNLASGTEFRAKGTPSVGTVTGKGTLSGAITVTTKLMGTVNTTATITFADNATFDATGCIYEEDQKILTWSAKPTNLTITGYEGTLSLVQLSDGLYAVDAAKCGDHTWTPAEATGTWTSTGFNGDNNYRDPSASAKFVDGDGISTATITIDGTRTVTSFVIDNTDTEYVLEGGNFIATTFEKKGTGTATLKVGADTKPGAATITAGTLVIGTDASNNSYKFQADSIVIKGGATLDIGSRDAIFNTKSITIEKDAKLTTKGFNNLFGVTISGGTIETVAGYTTGWRSWCLTDTLTVTGDVTSYITTGANPGSNYGLQLATGIFDVQGTSTLEVSTPMQDGPGDRGSLRNQVRKTGTGTMIVKTTPTYTGDTVISNGTYVLDCEITSGTYQVAEGAVLEMKTNRGLTVSGEGTVKVVLTDDDLSTGDTIVAFTVPSEETAPTVTVLNEKGDDITNDCDIEGGSIKSKYVAKIGTTYYLTLQAAFTAAGEEYAKVVLVADTAETDVTVVAGQCISLYLNNHTLTADGQGVDNYGVLSILGGQDADDENVTGAIVAREGAINIYSNSVTEIYSGTFTSTDNAVVMGNGTAGQDIISLEINGGTFNSSIKTAGYIACGVYIPNKAGEYGAYYIWGGTFNITNGCGICARAGTTYIDEGVVFNLVNDGEVKGWVGDSKTEVPGVDVYFDWTTTPAYPGYTEGDTIYSQDNTFTTASDQEWSAEPDEYGYYKLQEKAPVTTCTFTLTPEIAGTTVKVYTNDTVEVAAGESGYTVLKDAEVKIVYTADTGKLFADGTDTKTLTKTISENGEISVSGEVDEPTEAKAKIGTTYYLTLQAALNAAKANDVVKLLANNAEANLTVPADVTLDLNDGETAWTLTVPAESTLTLYGTLKTADAGANFVNNGTLLINPSAAVYMGATKWFGTDGVFAELSEGTLSQTRISADRGNKYVLSEDCTAMLAATKALFNAYDDEFWFCDGATVTTTGADMDAATFLAKAKTDVVHANVAEISENTYGLVAWLKYYATVYADGQPYTWAGLGTGDAYYAEGVTVDATTAGVTNIGGQVYYVSKLLRKGTPDDLVCEFEYDGTTLTKKGTPTLDVTIDGTTLSYKVTTGEPYTLDSLGHACIGGVYYTKYVASSGPTPASGSETKVEPVAGEENTYKVEPTGSGTTVAVENVTPGDVLVVGATVTEIGVNGGESAGATIKVMNSGNTAEIPNAAMKGWSGNKFDAALNPDAEVTVGEETIPVTPAVDADAETPVGVTDTQASVAMRTIPGLTYQLIRGDEPGVIETPLTTEGAVKTATGVDTTLVDTAKPTDKAFYKVQVTK